jgi:hypothetical protein
MLSSQMLLAAIPILALAAIVVLHLTMAWACPNRSPWWSLSIASLAGVILSVVATIYVSANLSVLEALSNMTVNGAAVGALAFCYFNFVNLNYTALRVRMLRDLPDHADGFSIDDLKVRYGADTILDLRLQRLISSGELSFDGSRYRLGRSRNLLLIGRVINSARSFLGLLDRHSPV